MTQRYQLTRRADGRLYDDRLGPLNEAMYRFAEEHSMRLEPRYYYASSWSFEWQAGGLDRSIEVIIQQRTYVELHILPGSSFDDKAERVRHFTKKLRRGYILFLPIEVLILLETLEMARKDAMSYAPEDLADSVSLE